jgi:hypothetical protein
MIDVDEIWKAVGKMSDEERQRAVLETFVRMHLTVPEFGKYTHVRAELSGSYVDWHLLDADDDSVREEKQINMSTVANEVAARVLGPFIAGANYERARMVVKFNPPTLQVDVLSRDNTSIVSGVLIDLDVEARVRRDLLAFIKEN